MNIADLKRVFAEELKRRRVCGEEFGYGELPGGEATLYGLTGAIHSHAALGFPFGDRRERRLMAESLLAWRRPDGTFDNGLGPGHGLHMVLGALHLLGEPIPGDVMPLPPIDPGALEQWLERHDWGSTHKELCGQAIPVLASGCASTMWLDCFQTRVEARLDEARPLETWCRAEDPPWRVISCIYHVLSAFDAGRLPYPKPELLMQRLLGLEWDRAGDEVSRTVCTDGDWALLLLRLCDQLPQYFERVCAAVRRVSERRVQHWRENPEAIMAESTHNLFCYLWVTAVFQAAVRDHYVGGFLRDTLNDPALYQLGNQATGWPEPNPT